MAETPRATTPTRAGSSTSTRETLAHVGAQEAALRQALLGDIAGTVAWARHVARRHEVPVGVVLAHGHAALELDVAESIARAALTAGQELASEAVADLPEGDDMFSKAVRQAYEHAYAEKLRKMEIEQRQRLREMRERQRRMAGK